LCAFVIETSSRHKAITVQFATSATDAQLEIFLQELCTAQDAGLYRGCGKPRAVPLHHAGITVIHFFALV